MVSRNFNLFLLFCTLLQLQAYESFAQYYKRTDSIKVKSGSNYLKNPWAGGLNFCQFSDIDLDGDGKKDLFVFDRTGNKITTFLNKGAQFMSDYVHTPSYESKFPKLESWVLLVDYNCDGKEDIFTCSINEAGIRVYKNTSPAAGNIQFSLEKSVLTIGALFIPANSVGIPAIEDIDNDGDLDIVTFSPGSWTMSYYVNRSKELGYNCDSLVYVLDPTCWGHFSEVGPSCSAALSSCRLQHERVNNENMNGSSCSLCLDMDNDGDKEIVIGQSGCCGVTALTNGGTPTAANMTSVTSDFPSKAERVNFANNPCGFYLDLNNDGNRDLLFSPNLPNVSINYESCWFYENIGTDQLPDFILQTRSFLQDEMIDVGEGADPVFFDYDADGLTDLLISGYIMTRDTCPEKFKYGVHAYKNVGSVTNPSFELATNDYASLSIQLPNITGKHLTFGDLDADGDADLITGDYDGFIHLFENTAGPGAACNFVLSQQNMLDSAGTPIDIGSHSTPQLVDVDRDGDLDLIIGERSGNLNFYRNVGDSANAKFKLVTTSFGGVDVMKKCCTGYSIPFMYDSAGSYRLLVGGEADRQTGNQLGWIHHYNNIDGNLAGNFNLTDSTFQGIWEGIRMAVSGADINQDGRMDLVIGAYQGGVAIYMGDTSTVGVTELATVNKLEFSVIPNPSAGHFDLVIPGFSKGERYGLNILSIDGRKIWSQEITSARTQVGVNLPSGVFGAQLQNLKETSKINTIKILIIK